MGDSAHRDLNPKCEDYHSDQDSDHGVVLDDSDRASPAAANVAAKRSHPGMDKVLPSDLQSDSGYSSHTAATMSSADSATSARSPPAASTTTATVAPMPPPSPAATATRRRQTLEKLARDAEKGVASDRQHSSHSQKSSQSSPRNKPLQRAPSTTSKRPSNARRPSTVDRETDDQNALAFRTRRPQASVVPSVVHSEPTPSTVYTSLSSPTYSRQPAPYAHGPTVVQPAHSRRRSSSTAPAPRRAPIYYQDSGHGYYPQGAMPGSYNSTPDHGPPLSLARYPNMSPHPQMHPQIHHPQPQHHQVQHPQMPPYMMPPGMQPGGPYYPNGQPMAHQASQPYDRRPSMSARNPSGPQYQTHRPESGYGTAQIIQPNKTEKMPSARYSNNPQPTRRPDPRDEEESDSSESEAYYSEEEQPKRKPREILPPPPKMRDTRPLLQKANTTTVINEVRNRRRGSIHQQQPERRREPRDAQVPSATVRTRAPSVSRPTLVQQPKAVSYPRGDKDNVVVAHSRTQRRTSYHPSYDIEYEAEPPRQRISKVFHDDYDERDDERRRHSRTPKPYHDDQYGREIVERKRSNRSSKVYQQDFQQFELEPKRRNRSSKIYDDEPEPEQRRRHRDSKMYHDYDADSIEPELERSYRGPDASALRRDEYPDKKDRHNKLNEALAYQQRTRGSEDPLNDLVHKAALKKQSRVPSDGASSRSDDKKSRVSRAQTTVTNGGNGEIRLRVDASAPISVALNGDMNGRTLQVVPGEDGMADIVIGSSQDNETVYGGERSSVHGSHRKSIGAPPNPRREAEEQSIRSSRSSHSRREADRRELERPSRGGGVLRRRTDFN